MIEAQSNVDAVIASLARHAERRAARMQSDRSASRTGPDHAWRSASALWPGFAQD
ncbi:hypothetical protein [Erythrobacter sp. HL-111]|uniref:hypothetical protein n=1 Tax=Erythrobacter sp. HL-111 TaxID=1798193 RepID=UPI0012F76CFD|nr:hypothetical protein [Erythrobacter sp. HL-111]